MVVDSRPDRLTVAVVAGETSGDILGAGLIRELSALLPDARFEGVAGPLMKAAGCEPLATTEELSVMGLAEVVTHLPRLLRLRRRLRAHWLHERPDVFVGIDAPDFNLGLESVLHEHSIRTVHYVSPSVWAWRRGRVRKIARAVDTMLTLFPFEADFYREHRVPVTWTGHPLADQIAMVPDAERARAQLGLPPKGRLVALLPGSRLSEVTRLAEPFLATAQWLTQCIPELHFVAPMANPAVATAFDQARAAQYADLPLTCIDGQSRTAMEAADAVLVASGTATLEAMLLKRPMVVAYRVSPLSAWLVRRTGLIRMGHYSIPNLLMERAGYRDGFVDEFIQEQVDPALMGPALHRLLSASEQRAEQIRRFHEQHILLRRDADWIAARAVARLLGSDNDHRRRAASRIMDNR